MTNTPIVVFDLETTGKDLEHDRVVQIALLKFANITDSDPIDSFISLVNPGAREIHPEAQEIHGITNEMLLSAPTFDKIADKVRDFIGDYPLCGFNCRAFDIPILMNEFAYSDMKFNWLVERNVIDIRTLWLKKEPRNLAGALKTFCGEELIDAHDAKADCMAAFKVLRGELQSFNLMDKSWVEIEKEEDPEGENKGMIGSKSRLQRVDKDIVFRFGKFDGVSIVKVAKEHPDYINWILKGNFEKTLKDILRKLMKQLDPNWRDPSVNATVDYN